MESIGGTNVIVTVDCVAVTNVVLITSVVVFALSDTKVGYTLPEVITAVEAMN